MTTIAWDGQTLAADTLGDQNGLRMETRKIYVGVFASGEDFAVAGAGQTHQLIKLFNWLNKITYGDFVFHDYEFHDEDKNDPAAILIVKGESVAFCKIGSVFRIIPRRFHACGSGRDYALMAMHLGKTAEEAVELACEFDCYSQGPVETFRWAD